MEQRRKKVKLGNREVEALPLTFQAAGENWNEYLVADGSVIRLKTVVTEVMRTDEFDPEGNPLYVVRSANVMVVSSPEELRRKS